MPGKSHRGPLPAADEQLVKLAADLRRDVSKLADEIGERNVLRRPQALRQAANWIEAELAQAGYRLARQSFPVADETCVNLEADLTGHRLPAEIVLVGAHYDSELGTPGANDNGTGVAALLALGRRLAQTPAARTLRFVAFVNEEPPFFQTEKMGSWQYARHCRRRGDNLVAMLSLETIGYYSDQPGSQKYPAPFSLLYPTTGNFIGFVANRQSASLLTRVIAEFRRVEPFPSEGAALPEQIPGVGFSDQWSFWQEGYPAVMVTDTALYRYPYYHTAEDTPDKVDFEKTARVARGLEAVVKSLGNE